MRDEGQDYEISNLIARMPGEGGTEAMLLWLIDLFNLWNEGADTRVQSLRADIAHRVALRGMILLAEIPADPPPAPREERGRWLLQLGVAILRKQDYVAQPSLANNCRRFLVHANAWVRGV